MYNNKTAPSITEKCQKINKVEEGVKIGISDDEEAKSPTIKNLNSNLYLVTWESEGVEKIFFQIYDRTLSKYGNEVQVCSGCTGASFSSLPSSERFMVFYFSNNDLIATLYDFESSIIKNNIIIDTNLVGVDNNDSDSLDSEDTFFVTFSKGNYIYVRRIDKNGDYLDNLNSFSGNADAVNNPVIKVLGNLGKYVIIYNQNKPGDYSIGGIISENNGTILNKNFLPQLKALNELDKDLLYLKPHSGTGDEQFVIISSLQTEGSMNFTLYNSLGDTIKTIEQYPNDVARIKSSIYYPETSLLLIIFSIKTETNLFLGIYDSDLNQIEDRLIFKEGSDAAEINNIQMNYLEHSNKIITTYENPITDHKVFYDLFLLSVPIYESHYHDYFNNFQNLNNHTNEIVYYFNTETQVDFSLNRKNFINYNGNSLKLKFSSTLANGDDLPDWIQFDSDTLRFNVTTPDESGIEEILIIVENECQFQFQKKIKFEITSKVCDMQLLEGPPEPSRRFSTLQQFQIKIEKGSFFNAGYTLENLFYANTLVNGEPLPEWIKFDPINLVYWGETPNIFADERQYLDGEIKLTITNECGKFISKVIPFNITRPATCSMDISKSPIVEKSISNQTFLLNSQLEYYIPTHFYKNFEEGDQSKLKFDITDQTRDDLPSWLQYDPKKKKFFGQTGSEKQTIEIQLEVSNECGETAHDAFAFVIGTTQNCYNYTLYGSQIKITDTTNEHDNNTNPNIVSIGETYLIDWSFSNSSMHGVYGERYYLNNSLLEDIGLVPDTSVGITQRNPSSTYLDETGFNEVLILFEKEKEDHMYNIVGRIYYPADKNFSTTDILFAKSNGDVSNINPQVKTFPAQGKSIITYETTDHMVFLIIYTHDPSKFDEPERVGDGVDRLEGVQQQNAKIGIFQNSEEYLIVWEDYMPTEQTNRIYAERHTLANNEKTGFIVNKNMSLVQGKPDVAILSTNNYLIVWEISDYGSAGDSYDIIGQLYNSDDKKVGEHFLINAHISGDQKGPRVSIIGHGFEAYMVVWESSMQGQSGAPGIYGQILDKFGEKQQEEFQINSTSSGIQTTPYVTGFHGDNANFIVAWSGESDALESSEFQYNIYLQQYESNQNLETEQIIVNSGYLNDTINIKPNAYFSFVFDSGIFQYESERAANLFYSYQIDDTGSSLSWLHLDSKERLFYGISPNYELVYKITLIAQDDCFSKKNVSFDLVSEFKRLDAKDVGGSDDFNIYCPDDISLSKLNKLRSMDNIFLSSSCDNKDNDYVFDEDLQSISIENQNHIFINYHDPIKCNLPFIQNTPDAKDVIFNNEMNETKKLIFINSQNIHFNKFKYINQTKTETSPNPKLVFKNIHIQLKDYSSVYFHNQICFTDFHFSQANDDLISIIDISDNSFIQFYHLQFFDLTGFIIQDNLGLINILNSQAKFINVQIMDTNFDYHSVDDQWLIKIINERYNFNNKNLFLNCKNFYNIYLEDQNDYVLLDNGDYDKSVNTFSNLTINNDNTKFMMINSTLYFKNYDQEEEEEERIFSLYSLEMQGGHFINFNHTIHKMFIVGLFEFNNDGFLENLDLHLVKNTIINPQSTLQLLNSRILNSEDGKFNVESSELKFCQNSEFINKGEFHATSSLLVDLDDNAKDLWSVTNYGKFIVKGELDIFGKFFSKNTFTSQYDLYIDDDNFEAPIVTIENSIFELKGEAYAHLSNWDERSKLNQTIELFHFPNKQENAKSPLERLQINTIDNYEWDDHIQDAKTIVIELLGCKPGYYSDNLNSTCKMCPLGEYSDGYGTCCEACKTGQYQNAKGSTACLICQPGSFANETGLQECVPCFPGQHQNEHGQSFCELCPVGHYNIRGGQTSCLQCGVGTFSNETGAEACTGCHAGTYGEKEGLTSCLKCGWGTYQDKQGQHECEACPLGTYSNMDGLTGCLQCQIGTYANKGGYIGCLFCDAGRYSNAKGKEQCERCDFNKYQPNVGSSYCVDCPINSVSLFSGVSDISNCFCNVNFYGPPGGVCKKCPDGAICKKIDTRVPDARKGYWHSKENPTTYIKCKIEEACLGGDFGVCNPELGYSGDVCSQCSAKYYKLESRCEPCPNNQGSRIFFIFLFLYVFLLIMFVLSKKAKNYFGSFTIAFSFLQILSIMNDLNVTWPENLQKTFRFALVFNFNVDFLALDCSFQFSWKQKWYFIIFSPFIFVLLLVGCYILVWLHSFYTERYGHKIMGAFPKLCMKPSKATHQNRLVYYLVALKYILVSPFISGVSKEDRKKLGNNFINCYTTLLTLLYLILTLNVLKIFKCDKRDDGNYYLHASGDIKCFSSDWYDLFIISIIFSLIYIIGIPLLLIILLVHYSKRLNERQFDEKFGLLCCRYSKNYFYWEIVVMIRKLFFVIFQIYLTNAKIYQLILCIIVLFIALLLQFVYRPYLIIRHNFLEFVLLFVSEIVLFSGLIFSSDDFTNVNDRNKLSVSIIVIIWFSVLILSLIVFFELKHRYRVKTGKEIDDIKQATRSFQGKALVDLLKGGKKGHKVSFLLLMNWCASINSKKLKPTQKISKKIMNGNLLQKKNYKSSSKILTMRETLINYWNHDFLNVFIKWYSRDATIKDKLRLNKIISMFMEYQFKNNSIAQSGSRKKKRSLLSFRKIKKKNK
ncbi:repeat outer membrane protein [Anaeramoeba flamelloides]|uniref:Repeat outer membrane protein n=1 Tax=Anaeramoeba flamelloides TaxID=1746091 RepID=A0ABQ8XVQ0_9EUKA|nr:repeat outer membrane protein [Anaeramoeba flamelloides]